MKFSAALPKLWRGASVAKLLAVGLLRKAWCRPWKDRTTLAVVRTPKQYRWLMTIVLCEGPFCVFRCLFDWSETACLGMGFASMRIRCALLHSSQKRKKTFHDVHRAFTFRDATPSCGVSARSFLSNLNVCKSFIGCLNLPPFFSLCVNADPLAACLVAQSGKFWQPELCFCQALGMPSCSVMSGKRLCRWGGGSLHCVHKSRIS